MSYEELTARVRAVIAATQHVPPEKITADSTFQELGIDSLAMIETVIRIEERFGIAMPDFEEFDPERVLTVEDLADMVLERLRA